MTTYTIDKRFHTRVARSQRVVEVAEAFGLGLDDKEFVIFDQLQLDVAQGDVIYITGQSGSGKSLLLRELSAQMAKEAQKVANLDEVAIDPDLSLIDQIGTSTNDAIRLLSIAGLNDAYLFIRKPGELYRFKLAKAIESEADVWVADEFMAVLDRTAAKVIAYAVQKTARKINATVIVATTHLDLVEDLQPSLYIEKRYREKLRIEAFTDLNAAAEGSKTLTRDEAYDLMKRMA
jgi:ABC-type ATPase with predicted acetyltransferase domain